MSPYHYLCVSQTIQITFLQYSNAPKQVNAFVTDASNIMNLIQPVNTVYMSSVQKK